MLILNGSDEDMVYNTRDQWLFELCLYSCILKNTALWKLDLFLSSGEGGGDAYSVVSVRKSSPQSNDH
jgi:hypothetical protein